MRPRSGAPSFPILPSREAAGAVSHAQPAGPAPGRSRHTCPRGARSLEILAVRLDKTMNELMAEAREYLFAKWRQIDVSMTTVVSWHAVFDLATIGTLSTNF